MNSLQLKSGGGKMVAIKNFINLLSVKSVSILIVCVCIGVLLGCSAEGTISGPTINTAGGWVPLDATLEWVAPEEAGWSSAELQAAHQFAIKSGCQAVMALYDGKVFFSRGNIHKNYEVHSIREAFLSALYGIHFARGNINLDATLEDLHIDDITPGLTLSEKQARVEHLLMSRSGVFHEAPDGDQKMIDERPARGSYAPDTFFYHNNWDVNALGTISEQETGEEICEAFKKEIADVVGMADFSINHCFYQYEWDKSLHPAYHFEMSARDMAKFGALYQKNGRWKGLQIIPSDWIDESTMAYSTMENTDGLGYGYMWKIIPEDSEMGQMIGYAGYYHTGAGGHVLVIIPNLKLVIVERYDTDQNWDEPGAAGFELTMQILDARLGN
jgi:CubicO group peptidase (beta-lactamase class C family)